MVYCGNPSPACGSCRSRRIKCDQKRPGCTQCSNISIRCPGYRNQIDLRFRDESDTVMRKALRRNKASVVPKSRESQTEVPPSRTECEDHRPASAAWDNLQNSKTLDTLKSKDPTLPMSLAEPIEDVARSHFLLSFIRGSHFDYLSSLYASYESDMPLYTSVQASALACLSRELREPRLMKAARFRYGHALSVTNSALRSRTQASLDSTLIAVLLLSFFERTAHEGGQSPEGWARHADGAVALLVLRGMKQLETPLGCQLFIQVSRLIRITCVQRQIRVPTEFLELRAQASAFLKVDDWNLQLAHIVDEVADLRADAAESSAIRDEGALAQKAVATDRAAVQLLSHIPDCWRYEVVNADDISAFALQGQMHIYPDHHVAHFWNSIRSMRLFLNEILYEKVCSTITAWDASSGGTIPTHLFWLKGLARVNVQQVAEDICASVPQFIRDSQTKPPALSLTVAAASFLLWPLSLAGSSSLVSEPVRKYAGERLHQLGVAARVPQASGTTQIVNDASFSRDWLHIYHMS